jgi:hypothetical protein
MKQKWEDFVNAVTKGTAPVDAFRQAFRKPKISESAARSGVYRLMKKPEIIEAIESKKRALITQAEAAVIEEIKKEIKTEVLSFNKKREILYSIATGKRVKAADKNGKTFLQIPERSGPDPRN